ncbi:MAG TPA: histidine kinase [Gemmatimonadaceae bacterium]|nr:histidine kinase [Gemmatimonadaceae bacterium]
MSILAGRGETEAAAGIDHLEPPSRRGVWTVAVLLFTVTGALRFAYKYFDDVARGEAGTVLRRAIEESTGAYTAAVLFVAVVAFVWRHPLDRSGWRARLPAHVAALVAYSLAHTTLMFLTRTAIFRLIGMGAYDYGYMPARYVMEFGQDAISYASFVALITLYRYYRVARQREVRTAQLERGLAQAELRNLRLQLQPHFLFNALNTISSTMYDDPKSADRLIGQLSQLLRLSLRTSHAQEVPLREELEVLSCYLGLMTARFGSRLRVNVATAPDVSDALVPSLLLQPLVENAIRHGNASHATGGAIEIRVDRAGASLHLSVTDDGPGAPADTDIFAAGIGLSATRDRLRLLYGNRHEFSAGNRGPGFAVDITLPYRRVAVVAVASSELADSGNPADGAAAIAAAR